jgi:hypothetical protein
MIMQISNQVNDSNQDTEKKNLKLIFQINKYNPFKPDNKMDQLIFHNRHEYVE